MFQVLFINSNTKLTFKHLLQTIIYYKIQHKSNYFVDIRETFWREEEQQNVDVLSVALTQIYLVLCFVVVRRRMSYYFAVNCSVVKLLDRKNYGHKKLS